MAGRALFRAYLSLSEGHGDSAGQSACLASKAMISAMRNPVPSFYRGVVGPAWVVDHLDGWIMDLDSADREGGVDGPLSVLLEQSPWVYDFDLIDGIAGMGAYAGPSRARRRAPLPRGCRRVPCRIRRVTP